MTEQESSFSFAAPGRESVVACPRRHLSVPHRGPWHSTRAPSVRVCGGLQRRRHFEQGFLPICRWAPMAAVDAARSWLRDSTEKPTAGAW